MSNKKNRSNSKIWQLELANKNMELEINARKQIERSLKDREDRFRTIYKYAPVTYFLCNLNGDFLDGNLAAFNLTGYTNEELFGNNFIDLKLIDKKDHKSISEIILCSGSGEKTGPDEFSINKKDGSKAIIELSTSPVTILEQKQILGIAHDITDRKFAQVQLKESEERFRKLFDSAHDAFMTLNPPTWKFTSGNPAILNMFKVKSIAEFLKYGPWDLSPEMQPDGELSSEKAKEMIKIAMTKGSNFFYWTHKRITGKPFPATVLLTKIELNDETFLQATVRDITEQKQADDKIRESEKKYRDLFEKSKDAILIINNGKFVDCNQATIDMLSYKNKDEFLNTHPSELSPEKQPDGRLSSEKADEMMKTAFENGSNRFEWDHKRSNGEVFPVEVLLTAISTDKKNQIIHTVWRDITKRKKDEEGIKKNNYQRSKLLAITRDLSSSLELQIILNKITEHALELLDSKSMTIYLLDSDKKILKPVKTEDQSYKVQIMSQIVNVKSSLTGNVVKDKQGMIFNNASQNSDAHQITGTSDNKDEHLMVLPLLVKNEMFGTLNIYRTEKLYRQEDLELAETFALSASIAIQNAQANQDLVYEIKERKQAELELRQSEERFKRLFDDLGDAVYVTKLGGTNRGKILEVNRAAEKQTGYSRNKLLNMNIVKDLYISGTGGTKAKDWETKLGKGEIVRTTEKKRRKDGIEFWTEVIVTAIEFKGEIAGLSINHDITDRKQAEEEIEQKSKELEKQFKISEEQRIATLAALSDLSATTKALQIEINERKKSEKALIENEEKFRSIVSNSPCVIMQTDRQGVISFINYKYSGQEPANIIGKTIYNFMPREFHEIARNTIKNVFKTGESYSFENLGFSSDESVVWYKNTVSSIQKNGKVVGVAVLAADISEQKQTDIMKTEFISSISHELRTPLTVIRESLALLSDELFGKLNKDQADIVNPCIEDVDKLGRIINNMLDISRMEGQKIKIEREMVDIVKLAQGVVTSFENKAASKNIKLIYKPNLKSINLYIDNDRIIQVFMNLIGNAIKFTEEGKIEIIITQRKDNVECCIVDTGRGIDQNNLGTIFDRFHQVGRVMRAGEKGTGLGLSISKGIIKLHKGKIWVNSKINEGSKFCFNLPQSNTDNIIIENIEKDIYEAEKKHTKLSLLLIRLNNYSDIESKLGVEKADKVIKLIHQLIQDELAPGEFSFIKEKNEVILFSDITKQNITILSSKLEDLLAISVLKINKDLKVDLSIGFSIYPDNGENGEKLIEHANTVLLKKD